MLALLHLGVPIPLPYLIAYARRSFVGIDLFGLWRTNLIRFVSGKQIQIRI